jgi:hypothetical protein
VSGVHFLHELNYTLWNDLCYYMSYVLIVMDNVWYRIYCIVNIRYLLYMCHTFMYNKYAFFNGDVARNKNVSFL